DACRIAKVSEGRRNSDRGCGFSASSLLIHERDNLCLWKSHAPRIPLYRHTPQDENFRRKMNTSIPVYVCRYRGTVKQYSVCADFIRGSQRRFPAHLVLTEPLGR